MSKEISKLERAHPSQIHLPPQAPPSEILEEDAHLSNVSSIIERDFFPNLRRLRTQNEFLSAVEAGDFVRVRQLGEELKTLTSRNSSCMKRAVGGASGTPTSASTGATSGISTPLVTGFTPLHTLDATTTTATTEAAAEPVDPTLGLSLDQYQATHTSEDNHSFSQLIHAENQERRRKYIWFFDKEQKGKLLLEGSQPKKDDSLLITNTPSDSSTLNPNAHLLEAAPHNVAPVQTWKYQAKNALMYYQDAAPTTLADVLSKPHAKLPPKSINHNATRLDSFSPSNDAVLRAASDAAADRLATQEVWRNMASATPALFPHGAASSSSTSAGTSTAPQVEGFTFVPSTPSLEPHADIDPEDLMTWGMIEGTPMLVDSGADHSSTKGFRIPDTPRREVVADKLAEKAKRDMKARVEGRTSASLSASANGEFKKPTASLGGGRERMLSPAAIKLLGGRVGGIGGGRGGVDHQLRASYSPLVSAGGRSSSNSMSRNSTPGTAFYKPSPLVKTPAIASVGGKQRATPVVVAGSGSSGKVVAAVEEAEGRGNGLVKTIQELVFRKRVLLLAMLESR
ncbi:hypothetical protein BCR33DRAFT_769927 [Rhizoclosmatium globosum]|uniref:Uncharacterized protein n=1 Tax=Rhizoclosmatium globosum TaxID=329046 RepID=A0A1Y2BQG5_9FUNG|nr:hypothetical protein BCR33DRAFT_769927 [Rhizoclosmatium globosum]|eukprot:ORY36989.1 hypothetical protein BCR33DRAFT_769927 [Rhizoclosmatium globosum]